MGVKQTRPSGGSPHRADSPRDSERFFFPSPNFVVPPQNASPELEAGFQPTRAPLHPSHASPPLGAFLTEPQLSSTHTRYELHRLSLHLVGALFRKVFLNMLAGEIQNVCH